MFWSAEPERGKELSARKLRYMKAEKGVVCTIEGAIPKNEVECALAIQMGCTHAVIMAMLSSLGGAVGSSRNTAKMTAAVAKRLKSFTAQVETRRRLQNGGSQFVRVEHVHIHERGQAIIGNVGGAPKSIPG